MTEEEFKKLFSSYGEISETFINAEKGFGFVRLVRKISEVSNFFYF